MTLQLDEVDIAKIAAIIRHSTHKDVHPSADRIAREIADMLGAMKLPVTISIADIFAEECRGCGQSITAGGLCPNCVTRQHEEERRRTDELGLMAKP